LRRNTERPNVEMPSISRGNTWSYKNHTRNVWDPLELLR
jgi:hypothetical protein